LGREVQRAIFQTAAVEIGAAGLGALFTVSLFDWTGIGASHLPLSATHWLHSLPLYDQPAYGLGRFVNGTNYLFIIITIIIIIQPFLCLSRILLLISSLLYIY
jgi:hypothetical protein